MRKHLKQWWVCYLIVLGGLGFLLGISYLDRKYKEKHTLCDTVTVVHVCSGGDWRTKPQCRVDLESGWRITTYGLVAVGDKYCWVE